jgi:hypothetical protein
MSDKHEITTSAPSEVVHNTRMHPLVAASMGHGLDPANLRELMVLQREYEAHEAKKAFTSAMVALKRDLPSVLERDKTVDFTNQAGRRTTYQHTTLAAAIDAIVPILTEHRFSHSWTPDCSGKDVSVTCSLTHEAGHTETCKIAAPPDTSGNKNQGQAVASTITLLSRYTLLALLGIATRDHVDPDPKAEKAGKVDAKRNLAAIAWLTSLGHNEDEARTLTGRSCSEWDASDLSNISKHFAPKQREMGEEG